MMKLKLTPEETWTLEKYGSVKVERKYHTYLVIRVDNNTYEWYEIVPTDKIHSVELTY